MSPRARTVRLGVTMPCAHRDHVRLSVLPDDVPGCEECLALGEPWLHLRICLECGHVGCCDESTHRHATAHANTTGHPVIRSLEPGEQWAWCYIDRVAMLVPHVTGSTLIPPSPLDAWAQIGTGPGAR
jgi:Zn-finger in ubiquitin-hydrolases and other protein